MAGAAASVSVTMGLALVTILVAGGIVAGPTLVQCSRASDGLVACLHDRGISADLLRPRPPPTIERTIEPVGSLAANAAEYEPSTLGEVTLEAPLSLEVTAVTTQSPPPAKASVALAPIPGIESGASPSPVPVGGAAVAMRAAAESVSATARLAPTIPAPHVGPSSETATVVASGAAAAVPTPTAPVALASIDTDARLEVTTPRPPPAVAGIALSETTGDIAIDASRPARPSVPSVALEAMPATLAAAAPLPSPPAVGGADFAGSTAPGIAVTTIDTASAPLAVASLDPPVGTLSASGAEVSPSVLAAIAAPSVPTEPTMPTIRSADPVDPPGPAPVEPAPWLPSPVPAPPQLTATVEPSIAEPALVTPPIAEPAPPVAAAAIPPVAPLPRDPPKPEQPFAQPLIKADTRYPDVTVLPIAPAVSSESFATLQLR